MPCSWIDGLLERERGCAEAKRELKSGVCSLARSVSSSSAPDPSSTELPIWAMISSEGRGRGKTRVVGDGDRPEAMSFAAWTREARVAAGWP
jgi:hypothetical protein